MHPRGNISATSPCAIPLRVYFRRNLADLLPSWPKNVWVRATVLLLLALCSLVPRLATCQTSEGQVEAFFRAGQEALKQGQFARAAEEFKKVLALDPTPLEAEVNLGLAYQSLFEYDLAVRPLAKALRERPNLLGPTVIV